MMRVMARRWSHRRGGAASGRPRSSMVNHTTVMPSSTAACPSASQKWLFPVPLGPYTQEILFVTHTLKGFQRILGRARDRRDRFVPVAERLAGGESGAFARVRRLVASRPAASSASSTRTTSAGSQRCAFAVGTRSVRARRRYGSFSRLVNAIASANGSPVDATTRSGAVLITGRRLPCRGPRRVRSSTRPRFQVAGYGPRRRGWAQNLGGHGGGSRWKSGRPRRIVMQWQRSRVHDRLQRRSAVWPA